MQLELQNLWRPIVAAFVLAWLFALGYTAIRDFNIVSAVVAQLPQDSIQSSTKTITSDPVKLDYASIADMFLMGTVEQTTTPQSAISQLPETHLNLSLRGLFVSHGSELSGTVIETGDKQPSFFQIGDLISEDTTLAAIEGQAAIIERNGNLRLNLILWVGKS